MIRLPTLRNYPLRALPLLGLALCFTSGAAAQDAAETSTAAARSTQANAPSPAPRTRLAAPTLAPEDAAEALRISKLPLVNGVPYDQPSVHDLLVAYGYETYLTPGIARSTLSAVYSQIRQRPEAWDTGFSGFSKRFGSAEGITIINGNVRLGMELAFHEDLRYLPCHHCSVRRKVANALLSEITARHGEDGRRFFTLTPAVADFSGPIIAHSLWYPYAPDPLGGLVATRVVAATRVGVHLFQEYWVEHHARRHPHEPDPNRP